MRTIYGVYSGLTCPAHSGRIGAREEGHLPTVTSGKARRRVGPKQNRHPRSPGRSEEGAGNQSGACPVVGIGASAGGLEAFTRFFEATPPETGMAFVLVQHLDPTHESLTAELLGKHTRMPVRQVAEDISVRANHVYVIPRTST